MLLKSAQMNWIFKYFQQFEQIKQLHELNFRFTLIISTFLRRLVKMIVRYRLWLFRNICLHLRLPLPVPFRLNFATRVNIFYHHSVYIYLALINGVLCIHWLSQCWLVVSGKLLLAFASTVILGSGLRGTHKYIFLFHDCESWGLALQCWS
jgi:hypothetical protein